MIPPFENAVYNKFVADQVLTSDNLNNMFGYLDEQGRMTRTQLIGTGISCGMQIVTTATAIPGNRQIKITRGAGITSEGYLVSVPEKTYTKRGTNIFNAVQCEYYSKFVNTAAGNTPRITLWELKEADDVKDTTLLTEDFLNDGNKIVLLFVELLEENNKNCDPSSCDDKGTKVTVTIRVLVAAREFVQNLLSNNSNTLIAGKAVLLPELKLPRFNAANPALNTAGDIFNTYRAILTPDFITRVKNILKTAYAGLFNLLKNDFSINEFESLPTQLNLIHGGSVSQSRLLHIQYYYDFIADLLAGYAELRMKAFELVCDCVPDDESFPRHLLLGEAIGFDEASSTFRTRFVSSGASCCCAKDAATIKFLFKRLVLMVQRFSIEGVGDNNFTHTPVLKITPSLLGNQPLSQRAIPYYFDVNTGTGKLFETWSYEKTNNGIPDQILSYQSSNYNTTDLAVTNPLDYDIEPYNFFRIEGITGKLLRSVLPDVQRIVNNAALPFKVVALSTGSAKLGYDNDDDCCSFADIELQYHVVRTQLLCCIKNAVRFWGSLEKKPNSTGVITVAPPIFTLGSIFTMLPPATFVTAFIPSVNPVVNPVVATLVNPGIATVTTPSPAVSTFTPATGISTTTPGIGTVMAGAGNIGMTPGIALTQPATGNIGTAPGAMNMASGAFHLSPGMAAIRSSMLPHGMKSAGVGIAHRSTAFSATTLSTLSGAGTMMASSHAGAAMLAGAGSNIIGTVFNNNFLAGSMAGIYQQYIPGLVATIPPPDPFAKADSISHYILVLIDELTVIASLLDTATPAGVDATAFNNHAQTLRETHDKLSELLAGYHTKNYLIEKIKLNAAAHIAEADKVDAAMAVLSDGDAVSIILIFLNLDASKIAAFISQLESKRGSYSAQVDIIKNFYKQIDTDGMHNPVMKEPNTATDNEYDSLLEQLKKGVCLCDIDNLKYLLQQYTEQRNKLTDTNNFSLYVQHHPGLQHKAGVTGGGTFVIVYKGENDTTLTGIAANTVIADFYLPYTCCSNCTPVQVVIQEAPAQNIPPVAAAGENVTIQLPVNSVVLDGRASSDPDGIIQKYVWTQSQGPNNATFDNKEIATPVVSGLIAGTYKFDLSVTDNDNAASTASVSVTVNEATNLPPVARATVSKTTIKLPENTVRLDGGGSTDPDGTIASHAWSLDPGSAGGVHISAAAAAATDVSFDNAGLFTFTLTVTDNKGAPATAKVTVLVSPRVNQLPVAVASVDNNNVVFINEPVMVKLSSQGSVDPDGSITAFNWSLPAGTVGADIKTPEGASTQVEFTLSGLYLFTLSVTDNDTATATASVAVNVTQQQVPQVNFCGALGDIQVRFTSFDTKPDSIPIKTSNEYRVFYSEIRRFYIVMGTQGIIDRPVSEQIAYFTAHKINTRLPKWISRLAQLIGNFESRLSALQILNIHAQLAYYAACIQDKDVADAAIPMQEALSEIINLLQNMNVIILNSDQGQRNELKRLLSFTIAAKEAVANNGEEGIKQTYMAMLRAIIEKISAMNL